MKKIILILSIVLVFVLVGCAPASSEPERELVVTAQPQAAEALGTPAPGAENGLDPAENPSVQLQLENPLQSQSLEMRGTGLRMAEDGLRAEVCFNNPAGHDLYAGPAVLSVAEQEWQAESWVLAKPEAGQAVTDASERCGEYVFSSVSELPPVSEAQLVVDFIGESLPQGEQCARILNEVQPVLSAQSADLQLDCQQLENDYQLTLSGQPDSAAAASRLVQIFYTVAGPWTVNFQAP